MLNERRCLQVVSQLPGLTRLDLRREFWSEPLSDDMGMISFSCLTALTGLKDLTLANYGLTSVPSAVGSLGGSLTSLSLEDNSDLQLGAADMSTLLRLRCLRTLSVRKDISTSDVPGTAKLWSNGSIQVLVSLPGRFMAEHGAAPIVSFAR